MANSKYEYIRTFESEDYLLKDTFLAVRVDGRSFHKFSKKHSFYKPNDKKALDLMNKSAEYVMDSFADIVVSYGQSDEYSHPHRCLKEDLRTFVFVYCRKILSTVVSTFTAGYMFYWKDYFDTPMLYPVSFDGRIVMYPSIKHVRDYLSWRQVDCTEWCLLTRLGHINNLYNTCFWALVKIGNYSTVEAEKRLANTLSKDKHEILFSEYNINYNNEEEMFKKGTTIIRAYGNDGSLQWLYQDIIADKFWEEKKHILDY